MRLSDYQKAALYQEKYISGDKSAIVFLDWFFTNLCQELSRGDTEAGKKASDGIIEKYLSDPGYRINPKWFKLRARSRVMNQQDKGINNTCHEIDVEGLEIESTPVTDKIDPLELLIDYKDVVLILYRSNYFSPAVKRIAKVYGESWCLARAYELRQVFLMTRLGGVDGRSGKYSGSGSARANQDADLFNHRQGFSRTTRFDDPGMEQGTASKTLQRIIKTKDKDCRKSNDVKLNQ